MTTAPSDAGEGKVVERRTMLKAAAAAGVGAVAWSAPRIETLGFAPAAAATPCTILSPAAQDKNSNQGEQIYCSAIGTFPCCTQSVGNQGNQFDEWVFENPHPGCTEVVVRLVPLDCETPPPNSAYDPDMARMAAVISSHEGDCECTVLQLELLESSLRTFRKAMNNGPSTCLEGGVDASIACDDPILLDVGADARFAVRIQCITGNPGCIVGPAPN